MSSRHKVFIVVGVAIVLLLSWMAWAPVSLWYHKWALAVTNEGLHAAMAAERSGGTSQRHSIEWSQRRTYHCERLVELGYFFHQSYGMDNLPDTDEVYDAILDRWMREFPNSPYSGMSATDYVFDVYDLTESKPKWDAFVRKYNAVDFVDRFVADPKPDAELTGEREPE